jgi:uncharacterized repeat protein (TIGR03803 family)
MWRICKRIFAIGILALLGTFATSVGAQANKERVLFSFRLGDGNSTYPSQLTLDKAGNLYGTTAYGGELCCGCDSGCGTVFRLTPDGSMNVLYYFECDYFGAGGCYPYGGVVQDPATGYLYGTTAGGGAVYRGTVFRLAPDGTKHVMHLFEGSDGADPETRLLRDGKGGLFGTTYGGGDYYYYGTVFKIMQDGSGFAVLHSFDGTDGDEPRAHLKNDDAGNLYGVTTFGGSSGYGLVFELAPDGTEQVLYNFSGGPDGAYPIGGLADDDLGNLYGTTYAGGRTSCDGGCGVIFKLTPNGNFNVLHAFKGGRDGARPYAGLLKGKNGSLYGTTHEGGNGYGTIFEITPEGNKNTLYRFQGGSDGASPSARLVEDRHRNLFGTTDQGGTYGEGTIFTLKE